MDCVKSPQQWDFVRPPMAPVETDLADHQGKHGPKPDRRVPDRSKETDRDEVVCLQSDKRERRREEQARYQRADKVETDVTNKFPVEYFARMRCK